MKRLDLDRWIRVVLTLVVGATIALASSVSVAQEPEEAAEASAEVATEDEVKEADPAESNSSEADSSEGEPAAENVEEASSAAEEESEEIAEEEASDEEPEAAHAGDDHDGEHHGEHHDLGHGNATSSLSSPAAFSKDLAIYSFVVFCGLLLLLWRFAWPTITDALEAREKRIEGNIAEAENKLEEARAVMAENEAKLAGAADQVRELLEEARRDADTTIAQAKADAKAEFEAERQRATRDIEQAADAAVRQLAEKTAGLAIDLAGRVVKQDISPDRQSEIVREALGRFSNSDPSSN